ncbi:MAG: hypothetical protein ACPHXV_04770 [Glaciecola sp.]
MSIDLSFIKDPEWKIQRESIWNQWSASLKNSLTKKDFSIVEHFFMTGEESPEYKLSDGALLDYFPLQSKQGWNYVFEHMVVNPGEYRDFFNESLQDRSDVDLFPHKAPYELARWDYFLGETFEPTITSRVPIAGEKVTLELDPYDVFCRIAPGFTGFLEYDNKSGEWPKWIQRQDYFWSLWPVFIDEDFSSESREVTKSLRFISRLLKFVSGEKVYEYDDPNQTRPKFLRMMEEKLDELYPQLCPKLQELWDETKAKKAALTK